MRQNNAFTCAKILGKAELPLLQRARSLQRLEQAALRLLPDDLAAHCSVMNLKNEILILGVPSPAWAARLRFAAPDFTKQLQCQLSLAVTGIEVRVIPETLDIQAVSKKPEGLSMHNATLLAQTAEDVDHPGLREALYRLAAKARES
ncbi:uncharacterized protein DUF721 [Thiogranum longum]|uniref:Uncharacterized protein DUF721 n=1 Tax=Thiogranum longum TaxID=1537524 RepID=A0A4R1H6G6_9GAMM|nr:DUF721 domain-containing protein [Thiogranum longum]TCK17324.1 uncharacterized protein DUF721 [Thiogranum longum]